MTPVIGTGDNPSKGGDARWLRAPSSQGTLEHEQRRSAQPSTRQATSLGSVPLLFAIDNTRGRQLTMQGGLTRSLGLWAIVGLGLGYMTPTVLFDTFGIVTKETNGVVPLTYMMALVVMLFTAISYGRMAKAFPTAGSSYTYTREAMHPRLGFMVGWAALLDYLLLPLVNALIIRLYMTSLFPSVPGWIWVVGFVAAITGLNAWSMKSTSKLNFALVVFAVVMIAAFIVLAVIQLSRGMGQGTLFSSQPFFHSGVHLSAVLTGATVVCFSFIGFDAITMYAEEAKNKSHVAKAII